MNRIDRNISGTAGSSSDRSGHQNHHEEEVQLKSYKDLFRSTDPAVSKKAREIPLNQLKDFCNHPYHVEPDEDMAKLIASIREHGVVTPGIAVKDPEGDGYITIAGHRRRYAARIAGLQTIPMIIMDLDEDTATMMMVDSNLQREHLKISEKAKAYAMKYKAAVHREKKNHTSEGRTLDSFSRECGESSKTVQRLISLAKLPDSLLELIDRKKLGIVQGVNVSLLRPEEMQMAADILEETGIVMTKNQSELLKAASRGCCLTREKAMEILTKNVTTSHEIVLRYKDLKQYFPADYSGKQMTEVIIQLLTDWKQGQE